LQFEDFQTPHALPLLNKYRDQYRMFNDDIQGTGTVALAAMMGSMRASGKPFSALAEQTFVVAGAGSAGVGIVDTLVTAMVSLYGLTTEEARARFWLVDHLGLLGKGRTDLTDDQLRYQRPDADGGIPLQEVLSTAGATVLLGVSGAGPIFTEPILQWMADNNETPLIFPMSNPTSKAECTADDAFRITEGRAIFGSGSPFPSPTVNGKDCIANQANNMYVFPGLGLGAVISGARIISDGMLMAAAQAVAEYPTDEESARGLIFPGLQQIRDVSQRVAVATVKQALKEGLVAEALEAKLAEAQGVSDKQARALEEQLKEVNQSAGTAATLRQQLRDAEAQKLEQQMQLRLLEKEGGSKASALEQEVTKAKQTAATALSSVVQETKRAKELQNELSTAKKTAKAADADARATSSPATAVAMSPATSVEMSPPVATVRSAADDGAGGAGIVPVASSTQAAREAGDALEKTDDGGEEDGGLGHLRVAIAAVSELP
jgi:malic enzyme